MNKLITIILGLTAVAGGAGLVVLADRQGWLDGAGEHETVAIPANDLCRHQLAPGQCAFCDPTLIEKLGWCAGHDVPEAFCTRCNPKLIAAFKVENDWCEPHGLPESQCRICNPPPDSLPPSLETTRHAGPETSGIAAPMIQLVRNTETLPRALRPPAATCVKEQMIVQFATADAAEKAGIQTMRVERRPISRTQQCNAELAFNGDRLAHLSPRAAGVVARVEKTLGDRVEAGDVLAMIDSVELGSAKAEYLQAMAFQRLWEQHHQRQRSLADSGIVSQRELLEAETKLAEANIALAGAQQRLRNLGLSDADIASAAERNDTSSLLPVIAPFVGVVIERHAVLGEVVDRGDVLFSIADTSTMWAMLDVYESHAAAVQVGQPVALSFANASTAGSLGNSGQTIAELASTAVGRITWVSPQIDPHTRTLKARAEINNEDGRLRANMFGRATITIHDREELLVVPTESVQWEGCCNVVFIKKSRSVFQPRKVRLGLQVDDWFVVEEGLTGGEEIVTRGSYLLKTEILKGSIGAGCCEAHPGG